MYGISPEIDWSFMIDKVVEQICIGKGDVQVRLFKNVTISIYGGFEHLSGGVALSSSAELSTRAATLVSLLDIAVAAVKVESPRLLVVFFHNSEILKIHDNFEGYESFGVTYPGTTINV